METNKTKSLAIIGCGPRGLNALENLVLAYAEHSHQFDLNIKVFERTGLFGCGQVYAPDQTKHNWMNISERGLEIHERESFRINSKLINSFPSYHEWAGYNDDKSNDIDNYSPRAYIGKYLIERFKSIATPLLELGMLELHELLITFIDFQNGVFTVSSEEKNSFKADEVVLTIGHQPTETSAQITKWRTFADSNSTVQLINKPYPIKDTIKNIEFNAHSNVAIRGFGLASIDIIRAITSCTDSEFKVIDKDSQHMEFVPGKNCPKKMIPFSLDGLPMHPKPLNKAVDKNFEPSSVDLKALEHTIEEALAKPDNVISIDFLVVPMSQLIAKQFLKIKDKTITHSHSIEEIEVLIKNWINKDTSDSTFFPSKKLNTAELISYYVDMASGKSKFSLDYVIGQVWRHCHPTLYKVLSYSKLKPDVVLELIGLDEKLKRLTFGPPLASLQQLLAVINAGRLTVKVIDDPDIKCTPNGWELEEGNEEFTASIMVNSVLDTPRVVAVETPIIRHLLHKNMIVPIHEDLGVKTRENGVVVNDINEKDIPLALLGRLAQGTLVGVDAILECFGHRSEVWANDAVNRMGT